MLAIESLVFVNICSVAWLEVKGIFCFDLEQRKLVCLRYFNTRPMPYDEMMKASNAPRAARSSSLPASGFRVRPNNIV